MIPASLKKFVEEQQRRADVDSVRCPRCEVVNEDPATVVRCHGCFYTFARGTA